MGNRHAYTEEFKREAVEYAREAPTTMAFPFEVLRLLQPSPDHLK